MTMPPEISQRTEPPLRTPVNVVVGGVAVEKTSASEPRLPRPVMMRAQTPGNTRPPLFYFGGATAGSDAVAAVVRELAPGPAFYACCFPGVGGPADGNWAHRNVASLAGEYVEEIRRIQPHGPYLLCGYSLGARIVFEAGRQIRVAGEPVGLLALLDGWGPGYPPRYSIARRVLTHLGNLLPGRGAGAYLRQRLTNVRDRLSRRAASSDPVSLSLSGTTGGFGLVAPANYRPNVYDGDIVFIRADVMPDWPGSCFEDPTNGWTPYVRGSIELRRIRCRHLELLKPPAASELARHLDECMARAV